MREGTQNSGDALSKTLDENEPVRIRIYVSEDAGALSAEKASRWAEGLWEHLSASDSGLRHPPKPSSPCRFITFEDFGTTGLTGDLLSDDGKPFYCFFRAENTSSKESGEGGSWGVGKTAFPRASDANAFFALTTREDDGRTVMMGSLTLRTRHVNGVKYTPDSWYGIPEQGEPEEGVIQPIEDQETLHAFKDDFELIRDREYGTSVVVPWCDKSITRAEVATAVIKSNFIPIVKGGMVVTISSASCDDLRLDAENIEHVLEEIRPDNYDELIAGVELAKWAQESSADERVAAIHQPTKYSVKWEQYSLNDTDRERLRERFDAGQPIAIRVPIPMRKKDGSVLMTSHLDVYMQRTDDATTIRPVFDRGSVVVPDHRIKRVGGAFAIMQTQNDDFGKLLRAAEDPGHKEWSTETYNFTAFSDTIVYAKSYLSFARDAGLRCSQLLQDVDAEEDFDLLSDVFSLALASEDPTQPSGSGKKRKKKKARLSLSIRLRKSFESHAQRRGSRSRPPAVIAQPLV